MHPWDIEKVLMRKIWGLETNFLEVAFQAQKGICCVGQQMATSTGLVVNLSRN